LDALIRALNATGKPVCLDAAAKLANAAPTTPSFDLHLRSAGLNTQDATALAAAIRKTTHTGPVLRSFSASYNPDLTDEGVAALADAFPVTMTELGLVGCSIGDTGGWAILGWAQRATRARMICVEANDFSSTVRTALTTLGQQRPSMMLVV
jgi:hypothetical protein